MSEMNHENQDGSNIEKPKPWEHLTNERNSEYLWGDIRSAIERAGRQDILQNPTVLDVGGGAGEFSKYLNAQGIKCVSLDSKDWTINPGANQVKGNAYKMPFPNESFDIVHGRGFFDTYVYWHNFAKLLPELARVLKTKGILSVYGLIHPPKEEMEKYFKLLTTTKELDKGLNPILWEKKQYIK